MAYPGKSRLRRSFSEHIKDSTNKAWDVFWKSAREKRLSAAEVFGALQSFGSVCLFARMSYYDVIPMGLDFLAAYKDGHVIISRDSCLQIDI